ncbi:MAG: M23 family metallopeptidase [Alphaproteobacteria bacterium]|nr:MAG: M23 family metallopeptidase [Alphaproteobacteria bacterium]
MTGGGHKFAAFRAALSGLLLLPFLAACGSGYVAPADIQPVYKVRNAPNPVPFPREKPTVPGRSYATSTDAPTVSRSASTVTVRKGDTLYAISRANGVPVRDLIAANNLRAPYALAVGQSIVLPANNVHVVRKGETSYAISRQYGVTVSELMEANNIRPPYTLSIGQKLVLPGGAAVTSAPVGSRASTAGTSAPRPGTPALSPPPRSGTGFHWPVQGKLASRFGPKNGGLHNDGINIIAAEGTPVRAAESGVVVYASNALEGYGNLLLIRHAGGWMTAYAHNERLLVRPGEQVNKGDIIARVGSTGGVATPQLHFEIRKGRQVLDPLNYLGPSTASAG